MVRTTKFGWVMAMAALVPVAASHAQDGAAPAAYYDSLIKAGAQIDALAMFCGKIEQSAADQHKAKMRTNLAQKGVDGAKFDAGYDASFKTTLASAKANPEQAKAACQRVEQMGAQMGTAAGK